jgi:hypothetical protein
VVRTKETPTIRIKTCSDHEVEGSFNHPVLTLVKDTLIWKTLDTLVEGDLIAACKDVRPSTVINWNAGHFSWSPVCCIQRNKEKRITFDVSFPRGEPYDHAFVTNGLVSRNCHPFTSWVWENFPDTFRTWWVFAASIYALSARQLLEVEVSHDLTALSASLTYDHASPLSDIIGRYETMLREWFVPAKIAAYRQSTGPGVVGVRPYRLSFQHRIYRIGTAAAPLSEFPGLLSALGIIY